MRIFLHVNGAELKLLTKNHPAAGGVGRPILFYLGFGAGGRLPIWHGVGGFMFNSSSSVFHKQASRAFAYKSWLALKVMHDYVVRKKRSEGSPTEIEPTRNGSSAAAWLSNAHERPTCIATNHQGGPQAVVRGATGST